MSIGTTIEANFPALDEVITKALEHRTPWDYNNSDDFIHYGISEELGIAMNRDLDAAPSEVKRYFWKCIARFGLHGNK